MDYLGKKCPVCEQYFHEGDDVVVCPDCGTPHHRECYEKENQCFYVDKHKEGFDYASAQNADTKIENICANCGFHNDRGAFFCQHCGVPLNQSESSAHNGYQTQSNRQNQTQNPQGTPFSSDMFDPLAGVNKDEDFGDGVTAGEAAKYVKQNTPYFIRIFSFINQFSRSRFNFCAAIFTGIYLLYRKMYKLGALIAAIQLGLMILYVVISYSAPYQEVLNSLPVMESYDMNYLTELMRFVSNLSALQIFMFYYLFFYDVIRIVLMIVIGLTFNRLYFSHCKKQINKIKAKADSKEAAESQLQTKGGVNMAIAATLFVSFLAVNYLPYILSGIM